MDLKNVKATKEEEKGNISTEIKKPILPTEVHTNLRTEYFNFELCESWSFIAEFYTS